MKKMVALGVVLGGGLLLARSWADVPVAPTVDSAPTVEPAPATDSGPVFEPGPVMDISENAAEISTILMNSQLEHCLDRVRGVRVRTVTRQFLSPVERRYTLTGAQIDIDINRGDKILTILETVQRGFGGQPARIFHCY